MRSRCVCHGVTITLSDVGEGKMVELKQSNLEGGRSETYRRHREHYGSNWATTLEDIEEAVESRAPAH